MSLRLDGTPRPRRRFRTRVFVSLLLLSLVTAAVAGAIFYRLQLEFIEKDRSRRAATLLTSLATQAELGAYAGDAALCDLPVRRTFREDDVVLAGVYDPGGHKILQLSLPALGTPPPAPLARLASLLADPDAPPVRLPAEGYDDMWAPIVTSARPAAVAMSSDPGGASPRREVVGLARVGLSLTPAREQLAEVLRTGVYLAAFLGMLGALAALLIARRISDPILALAAGADAIRSGNLDVEIAVGSEDEIGLLAASFNAMAAELRETLTKLESLNRNLEAEVLRRTDEIRRSAEFTAVLNAAHEGEELKRLLEDALATLLAATEVRAAAILLTNEEALEFELHFAAKRGDDAEAFGPMPPHTALAIGAPIVEPTRAIVPVLVRGQPEGAIILVEPTREAIDFAARAAGQLAIAVSNARAYNALQHLAR
ncbi:MAG: HAMP domain-containing protein, partial [Polyangia bacterium]